MNPDPKKLLILTVEIHSQLDGPSFTDTSKNKYKEIHKATMKLPENDLGLDSVFAEGQDYIQAILNVVREWEKAQGKVPENLHNTSTVEIAESEDLPPVELHPALTEVCIGEYKLRKANRQGTIFLNTVFSTGADGCTAAELIRAGAKNPYTIYNNTKYAQDHIVKEEVDGVFRFYHKP